MNNKKNVYFDAKKTYLGRVETLNDNAKYSESPIEQKIVVLTKTNSGLKPMYTDYEYHRLIETQPVVSFLAHNERGLFGYINEEQLNKAILRTGLQEAKRLSRNNEKVLKKIA